MEEEDLALEYKHSIMEEVVAGEEEAAEGAAVAKTKTMATDKSTKRTLHLADSAQEFNNVVVVEKEEVVIKAEEEEEAALGASLKQQLNNNLKLNNSSSPIQTHNLNRI